MEEMAEGGGHLTGAAGAGVGAGDQTGGEGMRVKGEGGIEGCGGSGKRGGGIGEEPRQRVWQRSSSRGLQVCLESLEPMPMVLGEEEG